MGEEEKEHREWIRINCLRLAQKYNEKAAPHELTDIAALFERWVMRESEQNAGKKDSIH
jgi:hypothetical protein